MPVVVLRAADVGVTGYETCAELEANPTLRDRLEAIRLAAGPLMGLGDVTALTVPEDDARERAARDGGNAVHPHVHPAPLPRRDRRARRGQRRHRRAAVAGTPAAAVARAIGDDRRRHRAVEHPTGTLDAVVDRRPPRRAAVSRRRASGIIRTARKLMDGTVFPRETD